MTRILVIGAVLAVVGLIRLISGGSTDTEGQTLAEARRNLTDAGVSQQDMRILGEDGDPETLIVCVQRPENVDSDQPVTLRVSANCPRLEDDDDRDRRKRGGFRFGGGRRF